MDFFLSLNVICLSNTHTCGHSLSVVWRTDATDIHAQVPMNHASLHLSPHTNTPRVSQVDKHIHSIKSSSSLHFSQIQPPHLPIFFRGSRTSSSSSLCLLCTPWWDISIWISVCETQLADVCVLWYSTGLFRILDECEDSAIGTWEHICLCAKRWFDISSGLNESEAPKQILSHAKINFTLRVYKNSPSQPCLEHW